MIDDYMNMLKFYSLKAEVNDATRYYVETILLAFQKQGFEVMSVTNTDQIAKNDWVLVITMKSFIKVYLHQPRQRIIMWFQGVVPEEARMQFDGHWSSAFRYFFWSICERWILRRSNFLFFVSNAMVDHFKRKYHIRCFPPYYIMPCFNLPMNEEAFKFPNKYNSPTFVYAGSLSAWQCIDQMLVLWTKIQQEMPKSHFVLLTGEKEKAHQLIKRYGLRFVEVKYVPMKDMSNELAKYKYGLLLREDNIVNRVATPTKLNSYMAAGVIPIFSDVIQTFAEVLSNVKYLFSINNLDLEDVVSRLREMESKNIVADDVRQEFEKIFVQYYSRSYHIEQIGNRIHLFF